VMRHECKSMKRRTTHNASRRRRGGICIMRGIAWMRMTGDVISHEGKSMEYGEEGVGRFEEEVDGSEVIGHPGYDYFQACGGVAMIYLMRQH
jgi:hypothetical protein